ncbi:MAG: hypothetical protein HFI69_04025 [Lachnospiraceae bacterium]|nr:hypothetical protein [Lachnospiraceae bacterium]
MRKMCNKDVILKYGVILYMITTVCGFLAAENRLHAVVSFFHKIEKEAQDDIFTSTRYRYEKKFENTLKKYRQFASFYNQKASTAVPGLEVTDVLGEACSQMVPQGICVAGDYMLVTAYDNGNHSKKARREGYKVSNSVLYVLSDQNPGNRRLLTTIVLPDINHVGGVAFDGRNVWIAKSTTRTCSVISYDVIKNAADSGQSSYKLNEYDQTVDCGSVASFLTFHDKKLWVGTYSNPRERKGSLRSFEIIRQETPEGAEYRLEKQEEIMIPEFANGAAFFETAEKTYLAVTTSRGRYFDSKIYFYDIFKDPVTGKNLYYQYNSCKFPPMAEELAVDGENTYFLFESSATCYSTQIYQRCSNPVDRICALSTLELFWQNHGAGYHSSASKLPLISVVRIYDEMYQEKRYLQQYRRQSC